ncbi:hypothetical protein [Azospirillum sp. Sh1]|uniref:hypothetical protein n=1 Tax=Azospirillum sp. Sh1 TaxID=2607285 RepID=UPI0011F06781|nr:hypothetical protein [Azospirillum sp. Sh1]KAA0573488.1 hypothetical protein FZ029_21160 [Azospirillum sp. Sh1]
MNDAHDIDDDFEDADSDAVNDLERDDDESASSDSDDSENASKSILNASAAPGRARSKKKKLLRRGSKIPDHIWAELREMYESGNYSQADLVRYAKSRGFGISQPGICKRIGKEEWVKGAKAEEIRRKAQEEMVSAIGENLRSMLDRHSQQALALQHEALQHFNFANTQRRSGNPDYLIPAALLRQIGATINEAQLMEARARGFDYREGKPFGQDEGDKSQDIAELRVSVMSDDEVAELKSRKVDLGEDDDEDGGDE